MKHIIIRGIPGSGKSTKAKELKEQFEKKGKRVAIYSRDAFRKAFLLEVFSVSSNIEEAYQESFTNQEDNVIIKDEFYRRLVDSLEEDDNVHIYDMTNISKEDAYFWFEFATYAKAKGDTFEFCVMNGQYKSTHNVPDNVMEKYKKDFEENQNIWIHLKEYIENF